MARWGWMLAVALSAWGALAVPRAQAQEPPPPLSRPASNEPKTEASKPEAPRSESEPASGEAEKKEPGSEGGVERERYPLNIAFGEGVEISNRDGDFQLRLRLMEQTDFKLFVPTFQEPARSGVYIPRFRVYFEGQATRTFEYELSLQRSVEGTFDVLDANVNLHLDDAFQLKVGRFLVPYSYEWYDHLEQFFIAPERGLFPLNFGLSREAGMMVWGRLDGGRWQYAVGGFDGQLAGLADNNTTRDGVGYLNFRPFFHEAGSPYRYLNIGGSVALGKQAYAAEPLPLRTAVQSSENDEAARGASAIFLDFEPDVMAYGGRFQAAAHMAWYYQHLSLEAEWQTGRFGYTRVGITPTTHVNTSGFHVAAGYFITGEVVQGRTTVVPLRPFDPRAGTYGPGAIELFARYSQLQLSDNIFSAGLADPDKWTRQALITDIGLNWYPNRYIKVYFDWQHAVFGKPVLLNEEYQQYRRNNDLFWVRAQVCY
ncbi:MAG: porin [Gemmataceae bacterium]